MIDIEHFDGPLNGYVLGAIRKKLSNQKYNRTQYLTNTEGGAIHIHRFSVDDEDRLHKHRVDGRKVPHSRLEAEEICRQDWESNTRFTER